MTVPLRLTIRRKHYSISCYLIGLCTLPRGLAYQTAAGGSMCRNPSLSLSPPSTKALLSLCLCNTSVLNTRHIRVPLLSRAVHTDTRFFHSIDNSILISCNLPGCFLTFFHLNRVAFENCNSRVEWSILIRD